MIKLRLRHLQRNDIESFETAIASFKKDSSSFSFAFHYNEGTDFYEYLIRLSDWAAGRNLPEKFVPNTYLVGVVENTIVGRISIRHELNDFLLKYGGHIGFGVVPGFRGQGYAVQMVKQALPVCAKLGMQRVLITCDEDNEASRKVIERCGGVLENVIDEIQLKVPLRRYWITL